jgi:hypothetical protein
LAESCMFLVAGQLSDLFGNTHGSRLVEIAANVG